MDRDPHPPRAQLATPDGDHRDVAGRNRAVADEMGAIFAPLASQRLGADQASSAIGHAASGSVRNRRSRTVRGAVIGACAVAGMIGAAFLVHPPHEAPRQVVAPPARVSAPPPVLPVRPALKSAPNEVVAETPAPIAAAAIAPPPSLKRTPARGHRGRRNDYRRCGPDCLRASELAAHRALERAYYAAADAGVSSDELADYQRDWRRLRRQTSNDPRRLTREYKAMADELYGRALEERSAPH